MVQIREVSLNIVIPTGEIGMVIMQPYVELSNHEPFRWLHARKDSQIRQIERMLEIAKNADHGCPKTSFSVFPEYSIPGLNGVSVIQNVLESNEWPEGTIVIGGVDSLTRAEYADLCSSERTIIAPENNLTWVRDNEWVNCCITWVKETDGLVRRWVQPKLCPAWPERNIGCSQMFQGKSVFIFRGNFENGISFRFFSLVCFDWIAPINAGSPEHGIVAVLKELNGFWNGRQENVHLVFVPQCNAEPNHYDFLTGTLDYFRRKTEFPFVKRDESVVIFANTAGGDLPGEYQSYGHSCLISSPSAPYDNRACPPSFAVITNRLRKTNNLERCKEALLREKGACIHSLKFRPPSFVDLGTPDRCLPVEVATVYSIDEETSDPRTPGRPVAASVKWANDHLDSIEHILIGSSSHPLFATISVSHESLSAEMRNAKPEFLENSVAKSTCGIIEDEVKWIGISGRGIPSVDNWTEEEGLAFKTLMHSLSMIRSCKRLEVGSAQVHAVVRTDSIVIDVIVVSGKTHEKCLQYAMNQYSGSPQNFILVITRDEDNSLWDSKFQSILEPHKTSSSKGPDITDPCSKVLHCGFQNLHGCLYSQNVDELNSKINQIIGM